jgi:hypothetical protein
MLCPDRECEKVQTFSRAWPQPLLSQIPDIGCGEEVTYVCRNCTRNTQQYWFILDNDTFIKVGQLPELHPIIDARLKNALGNSRSLYMKAVRSRSFGYGIGALAYLRRIIDEYRAGLMAAGFEHVEIVDGGSDLNAYAKVENQSGCCTPAMSEDACCTPALDTEPGTLHAELSDLLSKYDVNTAAASVKVYAIKPRTDASGPTTVPCCAQRCCS